MGHINLRRKIEEGRRKRTSMEDVRGKKEEFRCRPHLSNLSFITSLLNCSLNCLSFCILRQGSLRVPRSLRILTYIGFRPDNRYDVTSLSSIKILLLLSEL